MTLPEDDDMDTFMQNEMVRPSLKPIIWRKKVGRGSDMQFEDMATSDFDFLRNRAVSFGTGGLCGCTALVIVGRKGVFVAHYWENISFSPDPEWLEMYDGSADQCFEKTVIEPLKKGKGRRNDPEQISLSALVKDFDDVGNVRAYLMVPSTTHTDDPEGYKDQWDAIQETVGNILPVLKDDTRWQRIKYDALDGDDPRLDNTARGKILFKYDPDHEGKRKAVIWIEDNKTPVHDDEWNDDEGN